MEDDDKPDFTRRDIAVHRAFMLSMGVVSLILAFFLFGLPRPSYVMGTGAIALTGFFLWLFYWLRPPSRRAHAADAANDEGVLAAVAEFFRKRDEGH